MVISSNEINATIKNCNIRKMCKYKMWKISVINSVVKLIKTKIASSVTSNFTSNFCVIALVHLGKAINPIITIKINPLNYNTETMRFKFSLE
jgi:intergrase/recombinase